MYRNLSLFFLTFIFICSMPTYAQTVTLSAPNQTTKPYQFLPFESPSLLGCQRKILIDGKQLPCDSNMGFSGEGLRALVSDIPSALHELELYQNGRKSAQRYAYFSTAGIALALGGWLTSQFFMNDAQSGMSENAKNLRTICLEAGFALAIGSGVTAWIQLQRNETHLENSVMRYNEFHPDHPIELKLSTDF